MSEQKEPEAPKGQTDFSHEVGAREERKLKAKSKPMRSVWLGFGAFGMIGWSVALPTLVGVALGYWLDHRYPGRYSWTLTLLVVGLVIGCGIAWNWVAKEHQEIKKE
jgi:ATP synthase protein I